MRIAGFWQRIFGLDLVDTAIHATVTGLAAGVLGEAGNNEVLVMAVLGVGLVAFAVRRQRALAHLRLGDGDVGEYERARMEDLEARVQALEGMEDRVLELEERLEFTERVLAREREPERLPGA